MTPYRTAIVREVSPSLGDCELSYLEPAPIDVDRAVAQHREYCRLLARLGLDVVALRAEPDLPDAVFVEDTTVALDEAAVMTCPGAVSRRPEVPSVAETLARYRPLEFVASGTVDGGDVMRHDRTLYVGQTARTSPEGTAELARIVAPAGYRVVPVPVTGCLHLKSAVTVVGPGLVLANRTWLDDAVLNGVEAIDVDPDEPWAANTVLVNGTVVMPEGFPATRGRLEARGLAVETVDVSELQKAEAGVSCMSVLLR